MSVSLNIRHISNEDRWKSLKNGDFVLLEGSPEHPIPSDLYRVFEMPNTEVELPNGASMGNKMWFIVPMGDGPFPDGFYPYSVSNPLPPLKQVIKHVNIEVSTVQE